MTDDSSALQKVYGARTPEELAEAYAEWAASYDAETAALGYCLPFLITAWMSRYVPADAGPILDAGCGTGLSGPYLEALGYRDVEGMDMSPDMLAIAGGRNTYARLTRATLGETLPFADGAFAAVFSTGVFTSGHAPALGLHELCRIVRPGGYLIVTVRDIIVESGGFALIFAAMEKSGGWHRTEESPPFRAFAIGEPDVLVKAFVWRKNP